MFTRCVTCTARHAGPSAPFGISVESGNGKEGDALFRMRSSRFLAVRLFYFLLKGASMVFIGIATFIAWLISILLL